MPPDRSRDPSGRGGPRPTLDLLQSLRGKRAAKRLRSHSLLKQGRPQSLRTNLKTRNGPARNTIPGSPRPPPTSPCASGTAASGAACWPTLRQRRSPGPPAPDRTSCPAEQHSLQASHQFRHAAGIAPDEELQRLHQYAQSPGLPRVQRQPQLLHHPLDHRPHRCRLCLPADHEVVHAVDDFRVEPPSVAQRLPPKVKRCL